MRKDHGPPATFSEPEAQRILARAAELEAAIGNKFTTDDLRQIAAKAGIDASALERAINESEAVVEQRPQPDLPPLMTPGRIAMLAGTGAVLGGLAVVADNMTVFGGSPVPVFLPSALFALYTALRHPLREGFTGLIRELGVAFGAFIAAVMATEGFEGASAAVTWSLMAGTLACGIFSLRGARPSDPLPHTAPIDAR